MRRSTWLAIPALLLVAAACTSTSDPAPTTTSARTSTTSTTTTLPPLDVDRLVVVDDDNLVVTMDRDGGNSVVLSDERDVPFQPVWSPDAASVAYSSRAGQPEFVVVGAMGGDAMRIEMEAPPFYFYWSPTGEEVGSLRNSVTGGLVHERFQIGAQLSVVEVDEGAPYYFSWSPDGDGTVAHVGVDRLDFVATSGETEALEVAPGAFQAPQWTAGGVVAAVLGEDGQRIVRIGDGGVETLVTVDGSVIFGVSASERYLAVQSFNPDSNSVSAALIQDPLPPNRLQVIDLATGQPATVTDRPAIGFFWSPARDRLLIIEAEGEIGDLVLSVWEDGVVSEGPTFRVSPPWFAEFLPFYDQYAQSMSLWAPDGSAYAFVGTYEGEAGVFVVDIAGGTVERVSGGSWVAWSPS